MPLIRGNKNRPATIKLSEEDKRRIAQINPDIFTNPPEFPKDIKVKPWTTSDEDESDK
jgi:hypothetical protein